jgi:hypothetical protein
MSGRQSRSIAATPSWTRFQNVVPVSGQPLGIDGRVGASRRIFAVGELGTQLELGGHRGGQLGQQQFIVVGPLTRERVRSHTVSPA